MVTVLTAGMALVGWGMSASSTSNVTKATWVASLADPTTISAMQDILDRRAAAVLAQDKEAFLADVGTFDEDFVRRQEVVYDNLIQLPLDTLTYILEPSFGYDEIIEDDVLARYGLKAHAPGVTIQYLVTGVDSTTVAAPWVPVFGYVDGRWVLAEEASDESLPYGTNGQPWDAGAIEVAMSSRTVAAFSLGDTSRATELLDQAEKGLDAVSTVVSGGWDGKVLLTAVQDRTLFDEYFASEPERVTEVAAIAVSYYDRVPNWHSGASFATVRVVINPRQLSAQPEELAHDLTHEFTHAAMGPVTAKSTPQWLVEGFAEYVAYKGEAVSDEYVSRVLRDISLPETLPADDDFYLNPTNYVTSWLACQMIAEQYGESHLIALYESFQAEDDQEVNMMGALGIETSTLTADWRDYMQQRL